MKTLAAVLTVATVVLAGPALAWTGDKPAPTTKQLNQQQMKQLQQARANAKAQAGGGSAQSTGDKISGSWGFSYGRNPITIPQAVVGDDVAITSSGFELGPLLSWSSQATEYLPAGMASLSALVTMASRNDGTPEGRSAQADVLAVLCYKAPGLADIRYGEGACGRIRQVVDEGTIVSEE